MIGNWPSITNGGCRFALQARNKFTDQVRILAKSRILWNHSWILLCPGPGEILYSTWIYFRILSGLKITEFLLRMKDDQKFQSYYHGLYDSLQLLYKQIFDRPSLVVIQAEKKLASKIDHILEEERGALEQCEKKASSGELGLPG